MEMIKKYISVLFFVLGLVSFAHATDESLPQKFQGFHLEGYEDDGRVAWDVKGDNADILGSMIKLTNIDANRYGNQDVNLKAKRGTVDKASGNIHLEKDVVITSQSGVEMTTNTLDWQKAKDLLVTKDKVFITHEKMDANGTGLKAHPGLKLAQLDRDVTVHMETENQKQAPEVLTITCDGPMEIDQQKNMGVFNTNVLAVQTGRELKTDRMEIYFDPQAQQIKEIICLGNVVITQGENKTFADKAVYKAAEKKMVLTGRPKLILVTQGEGGLSGLGDMMKAKTNEDKKDQPKEEKK